MKEISSKKRCPSMNQINFCCSNSCDRSKRWKEIFSAVSLLYRRRLVHSTKICSLGIISLLGLSILPLSSNSHRFSMPSIKNCNVTSSLHFDFQKILSRDKKFLTIFALIVELLGVFVTFFLDRGQINFMPHLRDFSAENREVCN